MPLDPVFGLNIVGSFLAFGLVTRFYFWPWLRTLPKYEALAILVLPHTFRFMGLSFVETGVVSPSLPSAFAIPAAYGDAGAAILAIIAVLALRAGASLAVPLVWLFNLWGTADLVLAFYNAFSNGLEPGALGAAYYIPTFVVPALFVLHALVFRVLLAGNGFKKAVSISAVTDAG